ncbi:MAG: non-canonical purine NTP pyrophosphatase, partial [Candidatus Bathyarchaeia archaeon]
MFATSNKGKLEEAKIILNKYGIEVEMFNKRKLEIQSDSIEEIAKYSALELFKEVK